MRSMLALVSVAALAATACVSQSKYNELAAEAENLDNRLKDEKGAREALEAKVRDLEEKLAALERDKEALTARLTTSESRLTASAAGYGQYQPIAPNDAPENRSLNRRIEIVLAPKAGGR